MNSDGGERGWDEILTLRDPPDEDRRRQITELAAAAALADGAEPFSEQSRLALHHQRPETVHLLLPGPDGRIVGYAQVGPDGTTELAVHPAHRSRGHGRTLLRRAADIAHRGAPGSFRVWSYAGHPAATALAAWSGSAATRELWRMSRDLPLEPAIDPPGPVPLPPGVSVRQFVPGVDETSWLELNALAFADHPEQGRWTRADLDAREAEAWFDPAGFFLAERDGALVAFHWTKVHPGTGSGGPAGEIHVLGVDPTIHGGGLGGALARIGLRYLAGLGLPTAFLYVDAGNAAAVRLYGRLGFTTEAVSVMFTDTRP